MNPNEKCAISLIMQKRILFLYIDQWKMVHCPHISDARCAEFLEQNSRGGAEWV